MRYQLGDTVVIIKHVRQLHSNLLTANTMCLHDYTPGLNKSGLGEHGVIASILITGLSTLYGVRVNDCSYDLLLTEDAFILLSDMQKTISGIKCIPSVKGSIFK